MKAKPDLPSGNCAEKGVAENRSCSGRISMRSTTGSRWWSIRPCVFADFSFTPAFSFIFARKSWW